MDFSVTDVQLLIVVPNSLLDVVCELDPPQIYIGLSKRSGVYLSTWCLCVLTTSFQRPLNAYCLTVQSFTKIGVHVSGYIKNRVINNILGLSVFLRYHQYPTWKWNAHTVKNYKYLYKKSFQLNIKHCRVELLQKTKVE